MAVVQIPNLPTAATLTGTEQLEIVQAGVSCRTTTQEVADLAAPILSFAGYNGAFNSTVTQTSGGATTANTVSFNNTVSSSGVSVTASTRITATNPGTYLLRFTLQAYTTTSGNDDIDVWVAQNGSNIGNTTIRSTLTVANQACTISGGVLVTLAAYGYVEVKWSSSDVNMRLLTASGLTNPSRPSMASAMATLTLVQE
jgi:hypothetical protein